MPRRDSFREDKGDDSIAAPPDRFAFEATLHNSAVFDYNDNDNFSSVNNQEEDPELMELERRLNEEVDEDFFEEPRKFNTLQRVIDVLGLQMIDDATSVQGGENAAEHLDHNPAYRQLKVQQQIVEGAIEHMAVIHCADLNGSVIQVGRVARQFSEAVSKVRTLRKQVRDIQDTLGASAAVAANPNEATATSTNNNAAAESNNDKASSMAAAAVVSRPHNAAAMSLRELWLKKLECEATLSLLDKLNVIRAAPARFDQFLEQSRIGAAVLTLSNALQTMFEDDVAQVQALHKIMEQLMLRKQKAEEIVWDTLHDVIYLRTGNGLLLMYNDKDNNNNNTVTKTNKVAVSSGQSVSSESRRSATRGVTFRPTTTTTAAAAGGGGGAGGGTAAFGMVNPFLGPRRRFAVDQDFDNDDDQSVDSTGSSGASLFSLEDDNNTVEDDSTTDNTSNSSSFKRMMIPIPIIEAELDLEADERRCIEELTLSGMTLQQKQPKSSSSSNSSLRQRQLPKYVDPILALRILVECLAQLKRLDDVERILGEGLEREIRRIVQREQARTFARLEKKQMPQTIRSLARNTETLKDFRRHLTGLLSAFGCVMIRLSHLAEILRLRIGTDKDLLQKIESPSSVMRPVLASAHDIMQREIKIFLKACLSETEAPRNDPMDTSTRKGSSAYESGLFSLGIVDSSSRPGQQTVSTATRSNVMEMSTSKFVSNVLFPKTKSEPQVRHALTFRRSVAKWTAENEALKKELAILTGEDTSSPSYQISPEETALSFLDRVIQRQLLPVLQEEAVNGTVQALERRDAFDPILDRSLYARPNTNEPQDVDMCISCQAMYLSTGPLFLALHRLPAGGEMYLPLVAVLEHVMLTFISRVKQQVSKICNKKTAFRALENGKEGFANILERRRPFTLLMRAYADGDLLEASPAAADDLSKQAGLMPLSPPASDTAPRQTVGDIKSDTPIEELADGVEGEELVLEQELKYLKPYFDFSSDPSVVVCSDEELMKASCLAHSLLKLASLLETRLKVRSSGSFNKTLTSTRTLQEAVKTIKQGGIRMAKFCRLDMLFQSSSRLAKVASSSTLVARDAVRIPSSVNDLGEYLTSASDNLREAAGNAVTAYTFSSLEQYIPYCLMQAVRVVAMGKGIIARSPLTMNGIEALDRSGSVLYRDLKGATSFDNSFWDVELAAVSFERSASFMAMMELEMDELIAYYSANQEDFTEEDFMLIFSMTGPRRKGDIGQYHMMKRRRK